MKKFLASMLVLVGLVIPAVADEKPASIRVVREKGEIIALEVPTITMTADVPTPGELTDGKTHKVTVTLYGEVHIADTVHYIRRNVQFEQHDKVFYELVSDTVGQRPKAGDPGMYKIFSVLLELDSQMQRVDYSAKNLVHADMTKGQLTQAMRKNGDTMMTLGMEFLLNAMRQQNKKVFALEDDIAAGKITREQAVAQLQGTTGSLGNQSDLLSLMTDPNRGVKLKRLMAASFDQAGDISKQFGPTIGGYLIDQRNQRCIEVFTKNMNADIIAGSGTNYAIYYGSAHLPDMVTRLEKMGFKTTGTRWQRAWSRLVINKNAQKGDPLLQLLQEFQKLQKN